MSSKRYAVNKHHGDLGRTAASTPVTQCGSASKTLAKAHDLKAKMRAIDAARHGSNWYTVDQVEKEKPVKGDIDQEWAKGKAAEFRRQAAEAKTAEEAADLNGAADTIQEVAAADLQAGQATGTTQTTEVTQTTLGATQPVSGPPQTSGSADQAVAEA